MKDQKERKFESLFCLEGSDTGAKFHDSFQGSAMLSVVGMSMRIRQDDTNKTVVVINVM